MSTTPHPPSKPAGRALGAGGRLLLLLGALFASLVSAELVVRALPAETLGFEYVKDMFRRPREFTYDTAVNSLGFHDVEHGPKQPGTTRVLLLGDSFVAAHEVPLGSTVGRRLEEELNRVRPERRWEVVSIGIRGVGQRGELRALEKYGPDLRPDIVVTLFVTANDVLNNSDPLSERAARQLQEELFGRWPALYVSADNAPLFFLRWSALNRLISHRLSSFSFARADPPIPIDDLVYAANLADDEWREAWAATERLILATRDRSRAMGACYALVTTGGAREALGQAGLDGMKESFPRMREIEWDPDLPDRKLSHFASHNAIPFLALQPAFHEELKAGRDVLYWKWDPHWTQAGHSLAARVIARFLVETETGRACNGNRNTAPYGND